MLSFHGNAILGRVALKRGDVKKADQYLLAAGATPGSPQLDSFGPNMTLAKELLEKDQTDVVLQFFKLCAKFWESNFGKLEQWNAEVRQGKIPPSAAICSTEARCNHSRLPIRHTNFAS